MTKVIDNLKFVSDAGTASRFLSDDHLTCRQYDVKSYGAVGDGTTDDTSAINACLAAAFNEATDFGNNSSSTSRAVYFPPGIYKTTSTIALPVNRYGHMIYGAGMGVSVINNVTSGSTVFKTDGFMNSTMRDMSLRSAGGAGSICYDWDAASGGGNASKENVWVSVEFSGAAVGLQCGLLTQASETLFLTTE